MLSDQELLRYSRHILLPDIDIEGQERIKQAHILIAGLGGLGSPVSLYLSAAGIGQLTLVDFDHVDDSNLQRQIVHTQSRIGETKVSSARESLLQLNNDCHIDCIENKPDDALWESLIQKADIVIDCTDNFATRFTLNRYCYTHKKPLVSGAAIRFEGQISVYDSNKSESPCYQCLYHPEMEDDLRCAEAGVISPLVGVIGSLQALEALKLATGMESNLVGRLMVFEAKSHEWRSLKLSKDPACAICSQ